MSNKNFNKNFGFSKFSQNDFYNSVNKELINSLDIRSNQKIVDLGCGSGGITNLILEKLISSNSSTSIKDKVATIRLCINAIKNGRSNCFISLPT